MADEIAIIPPDPRDDNNNNNNNNNNNEAAAGPPNNNNPPVPPARNGRMELDGPLNDGSDDSDDELQVVDPLEVAERQRFRNPRRAVRFAQPPIDLHMDSDDDDDGRAEAWRAREQLLGARAIMHREPVRAARLAARRAPPRNAADVPGVAARPQVLRRPQVARPPAARAPPAGAGAGAAADGAAAAVRRGYIPIFQTRPPRRPCEESVESVNRKIREASEKGTLLNYLFSHSSEGPQFTTKGTPLHVACCDPDGERGEAKIALILQAANQAGLSPQLLASARSEGTGLNHGGHTPLHRLLVNSSATTQSMEMVCSAWPSAIFAKTHVYNSTPLCDASYGCLLRTLDGFQAKLEIMLNIARQMPGGVESLIAHRGHEGSTALHDAVHSPRWNSPENIPFRNNIFAIMLQACPSAIHVIDDQGRSPLHVCLGPRQPPRGLPNENRSLLDLVRVLVSNTTKPCLAAALATEKYATSHDKTYGETPIDLVRLVGLTEVEEYFKEQARIQDASNGWTLLHYAAANTIRLAERPARPNDPLRRNLFGGGDGRRPMRLVEVRVRRGGREQERIVVGGGGDRPAAAAAVRLGGANAAQARANPPVRPNDAANDQEGGAVGILGNVGRPGVQALPPVINVVARRPRNDVERMNDQERPDQDQRPVGGEGGQRRRRVRVRIRVRRVPRRQAREGQGDAAQGEPEQQGDAVPEEGRRIADAVAGGGAARNEVNVVNRVGLERRGRVIPRAEGMAIAAEDREARRLARERRAAERQRVLARRARAVAVGGILRGRGVRRAREDRSDDEEDQARPRQRRRLDLRLAEAGAREGAQGVERAGENDSVLQRQQQEREQMEGALQRQQQARELRQELRERVEQRMEQRRQAVRVRMEQRQREARDRVDRARELMDQAVDRRDRLRLRGARIEEDRRRIADIAPVVQLAQEEIRRLEQERGNGGNVNVANAVARRLQEFLENIRRPGADGADGAAGEAQANQDGEPLEPEKRRGTKKLLDWLLEVHPVSCSIPDSIGRLPIHLAIESGKEWENGVQSLARGFPGGVSTVDPASGLLPFMSAATGVDTDLDTIFELLRFAPHNLPAATNSET